jgi:hypothetical protein
MRNGGAEQGHDPVAGVLVHRTLEAVHALGENLKEALENPVPPFRIELLGQLHRALDVGEQHGDLLALAFEGGLRLQDLVGEVFGSVAARTSRQVVRGGGAGGLPTSPAPHSPQNFSPAA